MELCGSRLKESNKFQGMSSCLGYALICTLRTKSTIQGHSLFKLGPSKNKAGAFGILARLVLLKSLSLS